MTPEEIVQRIESSWADWLHALEGIPEPLAVEPGAVGYYSIKDLIGHVAFWDECDLERAQKIARGEDVQPNDWATMNDREYESRKHEPLESQRTWMLDAHARLVEELSNFNPLDDRLKLSDTWEHYEDHAEQVRAWRGSKGI